MRALLKILFTAALLVLPFSVFAQGIDPALSTPITLNNAASVRDIFTGFLNGSGDMNSVAFSPISDGTTLTLAAADFTSIAVWTLTADNVADPQSVKLDGHTNAVTGVAFSPDGTLIASSGRDNTVRLWNVAAGTEQMQFAGHTSAVNDVDFSPDGTLLASVSDDLTVRLWDVATGAEVRTMQGHTGSVLSSAFSPNGDLLATSSSDQTIRIWNVADGTEAEVLQSAHAAVQDLAFTPDGALLATGNDDGTISLWSVYQWREVQVLEGHGGAVTGVAFHPSGDLLASSSRDGSYRLWNMYSFAEENLLTGPRFAAMSVAFAPDGLVIAGGADGGVLLYGISSAQQGVIGTAQQAVNPYVELGQMETCAVEVDETVMAIGRSDNGDLLIYAAGMGCEGQVWLAPQESSLIAWSDESALTSLPTVYQQPPSQPIRSLPEYNSLCQAAADPNADFGNMPQHTAPFTIYDPDAPFDFYPAEVMPTDATGIDVTICRSVTPVEVEICAYDGGIQSRRIRNDEVYTVINVETGAIVERQTIDGAEPPPCPESVPLAGEISADPLEPEAALQPWLFELLLGSQSASAGGSVARSTINGDNVNARSGPGTGYNPIASLSFGTPVSLIARDFSSGWVLVLLPDMTQAWVNATLIAPASSTSIRSLPEASGEAASVAIPLP